MGVNPRRPAIRAPIKKRQPSAIVMLEWSMPSIARRGAVLGSCAHFRLNQVECAGTESVQPDHSNGDSR